MNVLRDYKKRSEKISLIKVGDIVEIAHIGEKIETSQRHGQRLEIVKGGQYEVVYCEDKYTLSFCEHRDDEYSYCSLTDKKRCIRAFRINDEGEKEVVHSCYVVLKKV